MPDNNERNRIGKRAENIFSVLIGKYVTNKNCHLLNPEFLGDKYPSVDFIVDLEQYDKSKAFFFVSVRATRNGYTQAENKLKVQFPKDDLDELKKMPVPTYLVGIDEKDEKGYILSVNGLIEQNVSSLSTQHPIDEQNIEFLWSEVKDYWDNSNELAKFISKFKIY
jgi:hypothetical protein